MDRHTTIELCSEKLAQDPSNVFALKSRALAFLRLGSLGLSLRDYEMLLNLDERNVDALFYSGLILEKTQRIDEAIDRFTRVLAIDPDHIKASYARGACQNLKGEFAKAIDDYTAALERDTRRRSSDGSSPLAGSEEDLVSVDEEVIWERLERATKILLHTKDDIRTRCYRAELFTKVHQYQAAIEDYTEVLRTQPGNDALYLNRGILFDELHDFDHAIKDYTNGIQLGGNHAADLYTNRGIAYRQKGDLLAAVEDYHKAISLVPEHSIACSNFQVIQSMLSRSGLKREQENSVRNVCTQS